MQKPMSAQRRVFGYFLSKSNLPRRAEPAIKIFSSKEAVGTLV
jgi:hypothetical protein